VSSYAGARGGGSALSPQQAAHLVHSGQAQGWAAQPGPQSALVACPIPDIFYGGARGGGKTHGFLGKFLTRVLRHGRYIKGIFFRREYKSLEEVQERALEIFPYYGGTWQESKATWRFKNGAFLKLRHLWDVAAARKYQGQQYTDMMVEEMTEWPDPLPLDMVRACLRSEHVPTFFLCNANPGGPGHAWVKRRYIDPAPRGFEPIADPLTELQRVYIPSKLEDNPILFHGDKSYEKRLLLLGAPDLVKAWRHGIWEISSGAYFADVWYPSLQVLDPFPLPEGWRLFRRSFDWGFEKPSAMLCGAIPPEDYRFSQDGVDRIIKRGSLVIFSEWYPLARDHRGEELPNKGRREDADVQGEAIAKFSKGRVFRGCVADPSIFPDKGQKSLYSDLQAGAARVKIPDGSRYSLRLEPADNARVPGWMTLRAMLRAAAVPRAEEPGVYIFSSCKHLVRTLPAVQRDPKDPDDVDTNEEDHLLDALRYLVNSLKKPQTAGSVRVTGY
jgi:hypothetical protein